MSTRDTMASCHVCNKSEQELGRGLHCCSRCKSRSYCSKECLAHHWKNGHKKECQSLQIVREATEASNVAPHVGDMPPAAAMEKFNKRAEAFSESFELTMDAGPEMKAKGDIWNQHCQEIMAKDPLTRTKTVDIDIMLLDASDMLRRDDDNVRSSRLKSHPFLAGYQSIQSHPLGAYGFSNFLCVSHEETIWKAGPWLCFNCQSPDTRYTSMSCKCLNAKAKSLLVFKLPVCPHCVPAAFKEKPRSKLW